MTIKKTVKAKPMGSAASSAAPAAGGATIADRFKLDMTDPNAKKSSGGKGSTGAVIVGLIGLCAAVILTIMLWKHWEFLMQW